ncbi:MAG: MFS transporter [Orrella sp.]
MRCSTSQPPCISNQLCSSCCSCMQQFSGINAVIYYAPTVFREAGFDSTSTQLAATIGVGVINVLMTLVGMALIDRIGRRKLLYLGFVGTTLSLGLIAIGAVTGAQSLDVLAVIGLFGYIAAFAASIGPLPWVMMSEIFPSRTRGLAMSVTSFSNWTFNFLVVFSFPVLVSFAGLGAVFGLYATVCAIGIYFTWRFVPETSGLTLEAIEKHLLSGMPFAALNGQPEIQLTTDKPDITQAKCAELTSALIKLSPYRSSLEPLSTEIASVAFNNQQIRTSLREIYARQSVQQALAQGKPLSKWMLGSHGTVVFVFLEHIRFASPSFLASVGEQS